MRARTKIALGAVALAVVAVPWLFAGAATPGMRSGYLPARDMTDAEALRALHAFENAGQIAFVTTPGSGGRFVDLGAEIDAVQFHYIGKPMPVSHVTPQFAVFLVRLAQILRRGFGAVALDHAGIYPGQGSPRDVHNRGSAIDVIGVTTTDDGTLSVLEDWGKKPKVGPGFRLAQGARGYGLFSTLYDFAAREAEDDPGYNRSKPPSRIGDHSLIITPDHPETGLAARHRDHVHIQIGRTVG